MTSRNARSRLHLFDASFYAVCVLAFSSRALSVLLAGGEVLLILAYAGLAAVALAGSTHHWALIDEEE